MNKIWDYLNQNAGAIGIVIPIVAALGSALWSFLSYMSLKRKEVHERRLHLYHDLITRLVSPGATGSIKLDCQIAIVYELTNFPEYFPVTNRILQGLRRSWTGISGCERLVDEINTAINTIGNNR